MNRLELPMTFSKIGVIRVLSNRWKKIEILEMSQQLQVILLRMFILKGQKDGR